jgi:hypothetical protein
MIAAAHSVALPAPPRRMPGALARTLLCGLGWGLGYTAWITAAAAWDCGAICVDDAVKTAIVASTLGVVAFAPIVAFSNRSKSE